jgi:nicotinamidase-related amidase
MKRPAIFVIDMLNDCFGHAELDRIRTELCSSINQLTAFARKNGFPVIWVRQEFESDLSDALFGYETGKYPNVYQRYGRLADFG